MWRFLSAIGLSGYRLRDETCWCQTTTRNAFSGTWTGSQKKRSRFRVSVAEISRIKVNHPRFSVEFLCKILFPKLNYKGNISYGIQVVILGQFFEIGSTLEAPFITTYDRIFIIFTNNNIYWWISLRMCWFHVDGRSTDRRYTVNQTHCWTVIWI